MAWFNALCFSKVIRRNYRYHFFAVRALPLFLFLRKRGNILTYQHERKSLIIRRLHLLVYPPSVISEPFSLLFSVSFALVWRFMFLDRSVSVGLCLVQVAGNPFDIIARM